MADKTAPLSDKPQSPDFEAELPLPIDESEKPKPSDETTSGEVNTALGIIRKKLVDAYSAEPDLAEEEKLANEEASHSPHQQFLKDLSDSGKSLPEMQVAWHEYYAGLTDEQKKEVWDEFNEEHEEKSDFKKISQVAKAEPSHPKTYSLPRLRKTALERTLKAAQRQASLTLHGAKQISPKQGLHSLGFGLAIGLIAIFIFMFGFFNERFIAPLIQPSRTSINASIITGGNVSSAPELIVPKINLEVPVVYGVTATDTKSVQDALERGVVHYADTAQPGQNGNLVIVGHSSNNILNPGKYKFAFVLLHELQSGDTFYLQKSGKRFVYQVYKREIVGPTDTSVLGAQDQPATASLITCDPPGTSTNRLVVVGKQISPAVADNNPASSSSNIQAIEAPIIPGNSPSLWSRLYSWLTH